LIEWTNPLHKRPVFRQFWLFTFDTANVRIQIGKWGSSCWLFSFTVSNHTKISQIHIVSISRASKQYFYWLCYFFVFITHLLNKAKLSHVFFSFFFSFLITMFISNSNSNYLPLFCQLLLLLFITARWLFCGAYFIKFLVSLIVVVLDGIWIQTVTFNCLK
jgi:hypothetical protein